MLSIKASNFHDVIKPIHFCSQIIGLTSFSIKKDARQQYHGSVTLYNIVCLIISTAWNIFTFSRLISFNSVWILNREFMSQFFESCLVTVISFNIVITFTIVWWLFFIKEKLVTVIRSIEEVDEVLSELKVPLNHCKHKRFLVFYLIALKVMTILGVASTYLMSIITNFYKLTFIMSIADFISNEYSSIFCSQAIFFLWALRLRYQHLNHYLMKVYARKVLNEGKFPSEGLEDFKTVAWLHDRLVDISETLSFCYGVAVMLVVGACFAFMILSVYTAFLFLIPSNNEKISLVVSLTTFLNSFLLILFVFGTSAMGQLLKSEGKKSATIIHKILNHEDDNDKARKLMSFSQQLLHRVPNFTCGLFSFDSKLAFSMISTASIYLIFLIQYEGLMKYDAAECGNSTNFD